MDYLQIYNKHYDKNFKKNKEKILRELKLAKNNNKNLETLIKNIPNYLERQETKIIDDFRNKDLWIAFTIFYSRHDYCGKNLNEQEVIQMILNEELKIEYNKNGIDEYPSFIKQIAELQLIRLFKYHFKEFAAYYTKVWEDKGYDQYFEENFLIENYEVSKEYIKDLAIEVESNVNNPKSNKHKKAKVNFNKEDEKYIAKLDNFTNQEKHILLGVLFDTIGTNNEIIKFKSERTYQTLPLSEYLRIIVIIKDLIHYDSFYKGLSSISIYSQIKDKHLLVNRREIDLFISDLNKKLDDLQIKKFQKFIYEYLKKN